MENKINKYAKQIVEFDIKKGQGGKRSKGESSSYGLTLKYLIYMKRIKLRNFASALGMSPQAFNYIVNHSQYKDFTDIEIENYCKLLQISPDYFNELVEAVEELLKAKNDN